MNRLRLALLALPFVVTAITATACVASLVGAFAGPSEPRDGALLCFFLALCSAFLVAEFLALFRDWRIVACLIAWFTFFVFIAGLSRFISRLTGLDDNESVSTADLVDDILLFAYVGFTAYGHFYWLHYADDGRKGARPAGAADSSSRISSPS
jgi:hypothetical protein